MANSRDVLHDLIGKIHLNETKDEIRSILFLLLTHLTGLSAAQIYAGHEIQPVEPSLLHDMINRINLKEPIHYILGEADFYRRMFLVNRSVLIPRPETEQIIDEVLQRVSVNTDIQILDIGTGSGCLAVTLSKELPLAMITATDISHEALITAEANAKKLLAPVKFIRHDILASAPAIAPVDVIISNPPYVTPSEKKQMAGNVLNYEPALALFVPENDPLIFYKAIASAAKSILSPAGIVVVEINQQFGNQVASIFSARGFEKVELKQDINSKDRIIVASRKRVPIEN